MIYIAYVLELLEVGTCNNQFKLTMHETASLIAVKKGILLYIQDTLSS